MGMFKHLPSSPAWRVRRRAAARRGLMLLCNLTPKGQAAYIILLPQRTHDSANFSISSGYVLSSSIQIQTINPQKCVNVHHAFIWYDDMSMHNAHHPYTTLWSVCCATPRDHANGKIKPRQRRPGYLSQDVSRRPGPAVDGQQQQRQRQRQPAQSEDEAAWQCDNCRE